MNSLLTVPNDDSGILSWLGVVGLKRTWDQKLSCGLLLMFMTTQLFHFRFAITEQFWLFAFTFLRTWNQELFPGLLSLTFMAVHLFQFRFAVADQYWQPSWLFTLTFFRTPGHAVGHEGPRWLSELVAPMPFM